MASDIVGVEPVALRGALSDAIRAVYAEDSSLLIDGAHERSVVFHVGRRLASWLDAQSSTLDVDLEYDRFHRYEIDIVKKLLEMTIWHPGGQVVPDLIVHDRRKSSREANVLVLEAKRAPGPTARTRELHKVAAYIDGLHYQHGVYVEFLVPPLRPQWAWLTPPLDLLDPFEAALEPVW